MSVKVKNVKLETLHLKSNKDFAKVAEFAKMINPDYKMYLPTKPQHALHFELTNANPDLANCIRRFILDEVPIYSMHVEEENIRTDDKFILNDYLKKQIETVPFQQELKDAEKKLTINIDIENKSDDLLQVYSRDINLFQGGKKLNTEHYFSPNFRIIKLRPLKKLSVRDITIVQGCGKVNAGKFCPVANIYYDILDVKPFSETKYERKGESSLNSEPKHFRVGFTTHRNADAKRMMRTCCDLITARLTGIQNELKNIKKTDTVYFSDLIELETNRDTKLYYFKGEYWSIANVISRYCFSSTTS